MTGKKEEKKSANKEYEKLESVEADDRKELLSG